MAAKTLMALSASIIFTLGVVHLVQCASHGHQHFFGLLCRQHCAIAGLTRRSSLGVVYVTWTGTVPLFGREE